MSHVFIFITLFGQSYEASRRRVCYQRGLPRLVSLRAWNLARSPPPPLGITERVNSKGNFTPLTACWVKRKQSLIYLSLNFLLKSDGDF